MSQQTSLPPLVAEEPTAPFTSGVAHGPDGEHVDHVMARIKDELRLLVLERATIQTRIEVIKHTLIGLVTLFSSDIINEELRALLFRQPNARTTPDQPGFTNICRQILRDTSQPLTLHQVCERMREIYPSVLARHGHPKSSLAVVLRRLQRCGEVSISDKGGVQTWEWAALPQGTAGDTSSSLPTTPARQADRKALVNEGGGTKIDRYHQH